MGEHAVGAVVPERGERSAVAEDPVDVRELRVVLAGELEHPRRDVERGDRAGARGQRPGEAPEPAADLDQLVARLDLQLELVEDPVEQRLAAAPEPLGVRVAVREPVVDEVVGVLGGAASQKLAHRRSSRVAVSAPLACLRRGRRERHRPGPQRRRDPRRDARRRSPPRSTAAEFEVIVVDDGSTDDTAAIAEAAPLAVRLVRAGGVGPGPGAQRRRRGRHRRGARVHRRRLRPDARLARGRARGARGRGPRPGRGARRPRGAAGARSTAPSGSSARRACTSARASSAPRAVRPRRRVRGLARRAARQAARRGRLVRLARAPRGRRGRRSREAALVHHAVFERGAGGFVAERAAARLLPGDRPPDAGAAPDGLLRPRVPVARARRPSTRRSPPRRSAPRGARRRPLHRRALPWALDGRRRGAPLGPAGAAGRGGAGGRGRRRLPARSRSAALRARSLLL